MAAGAVGKPSHFTRIAFGVGGIADGVKNNGFDYFLLFYYSQVLGVQASLVAAALFIALLVDAVSDPVVGYWSDNLRTRLGRRHPFMYAAIVPVAVAYFFAWNPPPGLSTSELFAWLVGVTICVRLLFTIYEVPQTALAAELTSDYDARTSLMSYRYFFAWVGGLSIQIALLALLLTPTEADPSGFFNKEGWHTYGLWAAIVIFLAVLATTAGTHSHIPHLKPPPAQRQLTIGTIFREILETVSNKSFRALFLATLFGLLATGISASLNQYINGLFWQFTTDQIAALTVAVYISAVIALILAPIVGKTLGKKRGAIIVGVLAFTIAPSLVILRLLGLMPPNGTELLFQIVISVTVFDLALIIATQMLIGSMIADIVEDSELQTGRRSEGIFFAGISFIRKLAQGSGVMLAAIILSVASIAPGMKPGEVPEDQLHLLGIGYAASLLTIWMLMILCVSFYRISREGHAANLEALAARSGEAGAGPNSD
ncbi:MFS transporter [Hyphomonas johnsonii]|jgi:Na+/melibiose symporter-like transporter|uniref:Major facilitator transporter n=1 Tax=Hyphomonas johnsonii MHS-2 TaxID=1280950 RepID=A0A059FVH1_9PROT|nr:MFS transporter [Hyphomonas johnsonii]KCZ94496.1 major facilitator transporter [Hyphomonas johnsonii MHS-2]